MRAAHCLAALACFTSCASAPAASSDASADTAPVDNRGTRYCEVLVGTIGASTVHIDVYSTEGLNECPDAAWAAIDTTAIKTQFAADLVILNGPRYWTLDSLAGSALQDTTVQTLGGIAMRKAGAIDVPSSDVMAMSKPYLQHTIHRNSAFHFWANTLVYELVDPAGHVYDMQSFSVQNHAQTLANLPNLGASLTLPTGWTFRTRPLPAELVLTALGGDATVVQDDWGNTYSLAQ